MQPRRTSQTCFRVATGVSGRQDDPPEGTSWHRASGRADVLQTPVKGVSSPGMFGHLPRRLRVRHGAAFAVLGIALATPAVTTASQGTLTGPSVPNCRHFSKAKIAQKIHVSSGDLFFMGRQSESNACTYTAFVSSGRYEDILTVGVRATSEFEFEQAEELAKQAARQPQQPDNYQQFGLVKTRGARMFYADHITDNNALEPCPPGWKLPTFGPPLCNGAPPWAAITVYSYGALKPRGPKAFVTVGLAMETPGDRNVVVYLSRAILSGKIR